MHYTALCHDSWEIQTCFFCGDQILAHPFPSHTGCFSPLNIRMIFLKKNPIRLSPSDLFQPNPGINQG